MYDHTFVYVLVAKGDVPLSHYTTRLGTFKKLVKDFLRNVETRRKYCAYRCGEYRIYVYNVHGFTYLAVVNTDVTAPIAFSLLDDVRNSFVAQFGENIRNPLPFETHRQFRHSIRQVMDEYHSRSLEQLARLPRIRRPPEEVSNLTLHELSHVMPNVPRVGLSVVDTHSALMGAKAKGDYDSMHRGNLVDRHPYLVIVLLGLVLLLTGVYVLILAPRCGWDFHRVQKDGHFGCAMG